MCLRGLWPLGLLEVVPQGSRFGCATGGRLPPTLLLKMTNQENEGSSAELHLLGSSRHRHGRHHPCLVPGLLLERVCLSDGHGTWPDHEDALLYDTGSAVRRVFGGQSLL